jgi:hypothetical protein
MSAIGHGLTRQSDAAGAIVKAGPVGCDVQAGAIVPQVVK